MIYNSLMIATAILLVNIIICLYRAAVGPTPGDRIVGINMIIGKTVTVMVLVSFIRQEALFLDVALTYSLIGFIATIGVVKYLELKHL